MENTKTPWSTIGYLTYKRCVEKSTPVLTANLEWIPAEELKEGDEILGFNAELKNNGRYIQIAKITHNAIEKAECVGIELEDGTILYSTPDHEWLVSTDAQNCLFWREAKDLEETRKHTNIYMPRVFGKPWTEKHHYEFGYLGAAFDGEGCLDRTNSVQFIQVQNRMLGRVEKYLSNLGFEYTINKKTLVEGRQQCYSLRISGFKNILRLLGESGSVRLIDKLKKNLEKKPQRLRCAPEDYIKIVRVFDAGEKEIAVLSSSCQ